MKWRNAMTQLTVSLPDKLALRAHDAGLLSNAAISQLIEDAMRREAGERLRQTLARIDALNLPPMSEDEVQAEIDAARAARRAVYDVDRR
jgi:post-segregation antitoxin (ccd killing protein)